MPRAKTEDNKSYLYLLIIGIIIIAVFFVLYKNFNFFKNNEEDLAVGTVENSQAEIINKRNVKDFDLSIFDSPKFKSLKEYEVKIKTIDELKLGKENPFSAN